MTKSMNQIIAEYKEYKSLESQLKAQLDELRAELIAHLGEQGTDEWISEDGTDHVIYRQVISQHFCSTEFKKIHGDLYKAFCKPQTAYRLTVN